MHNDVIDQKLTEPAIKDIALLVQQAALPSVAPSGFNPGKPFVVIGQNQKVHVLDYEPESPARINATVQTHTPQSFIRYVNEQKIDTTVIFADGTGAVPKFTALIDYHGKANTDPSHVGHRVVFSPVQSENWKRWSAKNKVQMNQNDFALFLEDNLLDVVQPDGVTMLKIVNNLEIDGTASFSKAQKLQDGTVKFFFTQDQTAKSGELIVPQTFLLDLPFYEGVAHVKLEARFRFRLGQRGELSMWYELVNPHVPLKSAFEAFLAHFKKETGIEPFCGAY